MSIIKTVECSHWIAFLQRTLSNRIITMQSINFILPCFPFFRYQLSSDWILILPQCPLRLFGIESEWIQTSEKHFSRIFSSFRIQLDSHLLFNKISCFPLKNKDVVSRGSSLLNFLLVSIRKDSYWSEFSANARISFRSNITPSSVNILRNHAHNPRFSDPIVHGIIELNSERDRLCSFSDNGFLGGQEMVRNVHNSLRMQTSCPVIPPVYTECSNFHFQCWFRNGEVIERW